MAFISQELINEIKSKNDIVDVISGYINLNEKNKAFLSRKQKKLLEELDDTGLDDAVIFKKFDKLNR